MSTVKAVQHQVGNNATDSKNIVLTADVSTGDLVINKGVYDGTLTEISRIMNAGGGAQYVPAGTGAVATTVQTKLRESVSVKDFTGFDPTGATDSTAAVQAAVTYIETLGRDAPVELLFPPGAIVDLKMVFITTGGIKLNGNGCKIVQNHDSVNSVTVGGAGQYKMSSAFFIKRGAVAVEITGFEFTTDDSSFPALAAGFGSYFASIGGQHFDDLNIHHNKFSGGQDRALLVQAGEKLRFVANDLVNNGITVHIGYLLNIYFYDGSSDTSTKYSPLDVWVVDNAVDGYSSTDPNTCLSLTGANRFTFTGNKLINMNGAAMRPIYIYSNDFGPYDFDGTARSYIEGVVTDNEVYGTFDTGIEISGDSTSATVAWTNSYRMNVKVSDNTVRGTGHGIKLVKARGTSIYENKVTVSGSPFYFDSNIHEASVHHNYFEGTTSGQNLTTIYCNWAASSTDVKFNDNKIVTPLADQYGMRATNNLIGLELLDNYWEFNGAVASCRGVVLTLGGKNDIARNKWDVDTTVSYVTIYVLNGNSNVGTLTVSDDALIAATGAGAASLRFVNAYNFLVARIKDCDNIGAVLIEDCERTFVRDNTIMLPASNTLNGILCDNTGYGVKALVQIHGNYIIQPSAVNAAGIDIASNNSATLNTLSKVTMNRVEGNSTGVLIRQTVQGVIETIGNTIVNNGTGGATIGVTGSATNTAL